MGIPEEDKGPAWLRSYGENSGNLETNNMWGYQVETDAFAVDLTGLKEFGSKLKIELDKDYAPHAQTVGMYLATDVQGLPAAFVELCNVVNHQATNLDVLRDHLTRHYDAVVAFSDFAVKMAETYGNVDATASASVWDVTRNLGAPATPAGGDGK